MGLKDLFSTFHEKNVSHIDRKKLGQFYTHKELVEYIYSKIPVNNKSKILDPCVGAGAFLTSININKEISKNLYGIDIDKIALKLCKENLRQNYNTVNNKQFKVANAIKSELKNIFPEIYKNGGFDIIIGNPPYQNLKSDIDFDPNEKIYQPIIKGVVNSASLIIIKSLSFLKEDGYLGFVLPKNLLRVDSFNELRKYIALNYTIIEITDLGHYFKDVRGDQIILIIKKTKPSEKNKIIVTVKQKEKKLVDSSEYVLNQKDILSTSYFPIFRNKEIQIIRKKLDKITCKLGDVSDIFRGLALSSNNKIISKENRGNYTVVYRGDSIKKFGIKYPLFIKSIDSIGDINKLNKLLVKKIILQNLCSKEGGITATYCQSNELSIDTVTNLVPSNKNDIFYILALLNSKLATFYLLHIIFLSSNFSMHTDKQYIGQIPFIKPIKNDLNKIEKITKKLLSLNGERNDMYFKLYSKLNETIYNVYSLNKEEIKIIEVCLSETLSKKQYYGE